MALLNPATQQQVREALAEMAGPVKLLLFTQGGAGALECDFCAEARQLVEEVAGLSDKITLDMHDFVADAALAEGYGVDKIPALVILADGPAPRDSGIRFYGLPSGYEFGTFIEDILMVGRGEPGLSPRTLEALGRLAEPGHIQVYVTPTCPHCPICRRKP